MSTSLRRRVPPAVFKRVSTIVFGEEEFGRIDGRSDVGFGGITWQFENEAVMGPPWLSERIHFNAGFTATPGVVVMVTGVGGRPQDENFVNFGVEAHDPGPDGFHIKIYKKGEGFCLDRISVSWIAFQ